MELSVNKAKKPRKAFGKTSKTEITQFSPINKVDSGWIKGLDMKNWKKKKTRTMYNK